MKNHWSKLPNREEILARITVSRKKTMSDPERQKKFIIMMNAPERTEKIRKALAKNHWSKTNSKEQIAVIKAKISKANIGLKNNWRGGYPNCVDCGQELSSRVAKRCVKCFHKKETGENSVRWKGGLPKCIDCGERVSLYRNIRRCSKCYRKSNKGENHYKWRGGKSICQICGNHTATRTAKRCKACRIKFSRTVIRDRVRKSKKYKDWRISIFIRDKHTCVLCGNNESGNLNVDHYPKRFAQIIKDNNILTFTQALECEELWNINNGRTLCIPCHQKTETYLKPL